MGIIDSLFGNLFGGGGKAASPDWGQIEKLMKLETELNRTNRGGPFSSWDWSKGDDGTWKQTQSLAAGMQPGADRLINRAAGDSLKAYKSPEQFSRMLDASMANMQNRMKMNPGYQTPEQLGYGPSAASQQAPQAPPPPQAAPPQAPPQAVPPQGGMPPGGPPGGGGAQPGMGMGNNAIQQWEELQRMMRR